MYTLHLIRHAKSSWKKPHHHDHDRPLSGRGKRDIALMAPKIFEAGCNFTNTHTSTAKRASKTAQGLLKKINDSQGELYNKPEGIIKDEILYEFNPEPLVTWIKQLDNTQHEVTIIGHNPALTELNNWISQNTIENIPTCGYVQLVIEITSWQKIEPGCAKQVSFICPKQFK